MFRLIYLCILGAIFLNSCSPDRDSITTTDLRVEHVDAPLGLDTPEPRFSWRVDSRKSVREQRGYHISVDTDSMAVAKGKGIYWNEQRESDTTLLVYDGKPLQPFTKYYWGVQVSSDDDSVSGVSVSSFETGTMDVTNWEGSWITDVEDVDLKPAPYFRREFIPKKRVVKARAYVTAAGLYELYMNGQKVGNHWLEPIYTRFDRRNLYVTHDVTAFFKEDKVAIGVLLGNGWYNHQSTAVWNFHQAGWRNRPRFLMNIRIWYADGTNEVFGTDGSWKTKLSPVVFNSIYTAEHYDARLEIEGWNQSGYDAAGWNSALEVKAPSGKITAEVMPPITGEKMEFVKMEKRSNRHYIFDLGRNIAGVTELRIKGEKGTRIKVTHAEQLDSLGNLDLSNIIVHYRPKDTLDPFQTDIYTLKGGEEEIFRPRFNYKGFQYVAVKSDRPINMELENIAAYFMHSDVEPIGKIHTSNETINKIWEATNASYLSNLFGYPTDCPQREKNGWTGDAHINIETGLYNYDAISVYEKWMDDHRDEQQANGVLPSIIPTWGGWGYDWGNGPDWTSTIAIIPWELYQFYGDDHALEKMYDPLKKYVDHITSISYDGGLTDWGLGDWVPVKSVTPKEFTSSIYYYVDATILAKAAQHFGKEKDHETYTQLAKNIKNAINTKYLNTETGLYGDGFQTELSAPLYWGIVPDSLIQKVADNLAKEVQKTNHIDVGLLGTKTILGALSQNGYADLAFLVASQETYPSWGWWIQNGATTLYENWDIDASSDLSRNHIMFGAISAWFYKGIGGILPDESSPGFKKIILKPNFVNGLTHFEAEFRSRYGLIVSKWEKVGNLVTYHCEVPSNSSAKLYLQGDKIQLNSKEISTMEVKTNGIDLTAGSYTFSIEKY
ncbi:alpha-L-rhamnosidase [Flagellimonas aequoris]|uniref:alpha-L-rhamnosidase n=1 Tax=Flagellimonas aequoris TaxID=2306997 RepID=A0A418N885_9FLAO|nr:alpha-L-rhamnosidase [Allomuricauda aequoris]RIV71170.1 alpha-rhamnosidase [Allomuricauda aequoris]TXK02544.1 Bacterial alpha-L-rhamnosidase [Allomuricauda aequoris]